MRLTHIKLSGFKSFVDPTTIPVPGQLVAVIGPNGCGKSNVIDAVRWVLGESSAKQLRGESMQDVIFNGATTRKPVSRASVELVFDNADGQLTGPWGQYAEVAIKRVLTRQGESSYLINNQVVRRRDITDLFLGTGVGARGYAVIEQGMISRIIEARPEELRIYLEEAAGVSRYKERRRETENRLADTRDNLLRVDDLRQELGRQVDRLTEQAAVAAQYQDLRAALSHKQNLLALARREEAAREEAAARAELAQLESEEARQSRALSALDAELENLRDAHFTAGERVQTAQQRLSDINAQLARLEEQQRYRQETRQRLERDLLLAQNDRATLASEQWRLTEQRDEWQAERDVLRLQLEESLLRLEDDSAQLPEVEAAYAEHEEALHRLTGQHSEWVRQRDLARQRMEHLQQVRQQATARLDALRQEQIALNLPSPEALAHAVAAVEQAQSALTTVRQRVVADEAKLADLASERDRLDETLNGLRTELARAEAEAAALSSLLMREQEEGALSDWLQSHELQHAPRLWQTLQVADHWRMALEAVLMGRLTARSGALPQDVPPGPLELVDSTLSTQAELTRSNLPTLRAQVQALPPFDAALDDWLRGVYLADSLAQAQALRAKLAIGEWMVTPEGHCIGRHSVQFHGAATDNGLMAQKARLDEASKRAAELSPVLAVAQSQREHVTSQMGMLTEAIRGQKGAITRLDGELNAATVEHVRLDQAARQGSVRREAILSEMTSLCDTLDEAQEQVLEAGQVIDTVSIELEALDTQLATVRTVRARAQEALNVARERSHQAERQMHDIRLRLQSAEQKMHELAQRGTESNARDGQLAERLAALTEEVASLEEEETPVALQSLLAERDLAEGALTQTRDALNELTERMRALAIQQQEINQALPAVREAHQNVLLKHQEARLARERYQEELYDAAIDEAALLADLGEGVKLSTLMGEIARLARAVEGLGAVNLAALEELEQARVREEYLGAQADDLQQAIATLEAAIQKIDGESRAILQATFDAVNAQMSELFPTLFGGGSASLTLTGSDLLDAGVQIIAQPPGKKNSTIHLLSGGEKALTAMSLVFSLFSLNPAPFCLLDEVDAPLDDANTGRFCELVKKMAQRTQFLYISHNRLTMEMAEQLIGVTMQEKGVSRVVAVDIVEALQMREMA